MPDQPEYPDYMRGERASSTASMDASSAASRAIVPFEPARARLQQRRVAMTPRPAAGLPRAVRAAGVVVAGLVAEYALRAVAESLARRGRASERRLRIPIDTTLVPARGARGRTSDVARRETRETRETRVARESRGERAERVRDVLASLGGTSRVVITEVTVIERRRGR